ncbi:MAG: hydantoinase/oxoprolinase family protein [Chloroflexota bacterium]|nr:hydantoinase/oxoprolinase family protein [Chloroflexota bacterium]
MSIRLAIDIGGTFTDLAAYRQDTGALVFTKSSTTPRELTDAVVSCVTKIGLPLRQVDLFIHGSTIGINTIIERKGPSTALITTKGFRDVYEMGRRNRPEPYDLLFHRPRPLVPRDRRFEVTERLDYAGQVVTPLAEKELDDVLETIGGLGVRSIAVCLLHSYAEPRHEQRIGDAIRAKLPDVFVSLSSDIHREFREYERTSTTVINAYLSPIVGAYLEKLEARLKSFSFEGRTLIMQSSGGVMTLAAAARQPVRIIESGPAGGVAGTLWLCSALGYSSAIAFDMGGTTAKACLIENGQAKVTTDYYVGGRLTGHPAQVPFLDIIEIGAGGGSIASVDAVGALRVGPQSAGAEPGPACYGLGGIEPTITDCNLVVGKLDAPRFLGGEMPLDTRLAERAVGALASKVELSTHETANGVLRIANAMMARAVSKITVERGHDPRDFVMIAYGGAGPMHATAVARELGVRDVIVPLAPAQFSALGMLTTDIRYDCAQTYPATTASLSESILDAQYRRVEDAARSALREDVGSSDISFSRSADMRYVGQFHTLSVTLPDELYDATFLERLERRFHQAHEAAYGHASPGLPTEIINLRVAAFVAMTKPAFPPIARGAAEPPVAARVGERNVLWEDGVERASAIWQREKLLAGNVIAGPAIIQENASVIPIGQGETARVDELGHLRIRCGRSE